VGGDPPVAGLCWGQGQGRGSANAGFSHEKGGMATGDGMRILLTGATGFIGRAAMRAWTAAGCEVFAVSRSGEAAPGARAIAWDLTQAPRLSDFPGSIDAVVHTAQSRVYRAFPDDAAQMFGVNVAGAQRLLDLGVALGAARFCLLSSGNVYEPYRSMHEDAFLSPDGYLGASKLAAEVIARPYGAAFDLSILRLFQPYGAGQAGKLVPDLIRRVREGVPVTLGADGEGMRLCPTYVEDVVSVIHTALAQGWRGVFNVATPQERSIRAMASAIGRELGREPVFEVTAAASPRIVPDLTRLSQKMALSQMRPFEDGLRQTLSETLRPA